MIKKLASDALGLSDIGQIIPASSYPESESYHYTLHEEGEHIHFLIRSKSDEYCFTNFAFIHLDGTSAVSKKRSLKRYHYRDFTLSNVWLETAGTVDLDVEIKFQLAETHYSIDVTKKQLPELKTLYKSLVSIASAQTENQRLRSFSEEALMATTSTVSKSLGDSNPAEHYASICQYIFDWKTKHYQTYSPKDYANCFLSFQSPTTSTPPNLPAA